MGSGVLKFLFVESEYRRPGLIEISSVSRVLTPRVDRRSTTVTY